MEFSPQERILSALFVDPNATLTLRDVAKTSGLSPATAAKYIKEMVREELIAVSERKNMFDISLLHNDKTVQLHRIHNMQSILMCGIVQDLQSQSRADCIVLTGAYAAGEDGAKSDIEITIIGGNNSAINLTKYKTLLKREIRIKRTRTPNKDDKNDLANGIVLAGRLVIS